MRWIRLILLCLLFASTSRAGEFLSPRAKEVRVRSAVLMPPRVELVEHGVKGSQTQLKEAEEAAGKLAAAVVQLLREKSVAVDDTLLRSGPGQDPDLRAAMASVQKRYDAVAAKMHRKPKEVRKGRFTLGDEIAEFPLAAKSEALVFVHAYAFRITKGRALVLGGSGLFAGTQMTAYITLVDSVTGDVLYLTSDHFRVKPSDTIQDYYNDLDENVRQLPTKPVS